MKPKLNTVFTDNRQWTQASFTRI